MTFYLHTCICGHPRHEGVCPACVGDGVVVSDAETPERAGPYVGCINPRGQRFLACCEFRERGEVAA